MDSESLNFKNNNPLNNNRNNHSNNSNKNQGRGGIGNSYDSNNENQYYINLNNNNNIDDKYNNTEERNYNHNCNSNPNPTKYYKNNAEIVRTILEPLGTQENKKYNYDYYPTNNANKINNNHLNSLTLENTSINNFNPNKANFENYLDNDRNASPCFSNMDKFTGIYNTVNNSNNTNLYNTEAELNRNTKKDSGMSFRKTDSQNVFKNNFNNSNFNLNNNNNIYNEDESEYSNRLVNNKQNLDLKINKIRE